MTPPPRATPRPVTCPNCGHTRTVAAFPNTRLRCPQCRTQYLAPGTGETPEVPTAAADLAPTLGTQAPPAADEVKPAPAAAAAGLTPTIVRPAAVSIKPAAPPPTGTTPETPAPALAPVDAAGRQAAAGVAAATAGIVPPLLDPTHRGRRRRPLARRRPADG